MMHNFGKWPFYSKECVDDASYLLREGLPLTAYRANPQVGVEPVKDSWAWRLEREIEKKFRVKHAIACNSGTSALYMGLKARGVDGWEIITTPYTFSATVAAILHAGATPVFADVDPSTFCISKETVKRALTKKTKAILPVHLFGYFSDVDALSSFGLPVFEDACQAVGARRGERYAGTVGDFGAYSFNGSKNVPAGEGGALVTNSDRIAEKARLLTNHSENFGVKDVGWNFRMTEIHACIAWHGLKDLEERNAYRVTLANRLPEWASTATAWARRQYRGSEDARYVLPFTVHGIDRSLFVKRMRRMGVNAGEGYIRPTLDKYPAFRRYARGPLPIVHELSEKTLCLLDCVRLPATESDMVYIADCMRRALR